MRYSQSTYLDKGPSNQGYRKPSRDGSSSLDGGNRVEYFRHDQARLIRQFDELKDRLNHFCDVTDKPKEKVPLCRIMFHEKAYEDFEAWFPTSSSGLRKSSMLFFMLDKRVSELSYFQHYTKPFPYVDIIYVSINVRSMHWALGVVHLVQRKIFVYDSLISINSDNRLKGVIISLAKLLPRILHVASYYGDTGNRKGNQQWDIERLHTVPQQKYK